MSKFDEAMDKYRKTMSDLGVKHDDALLTKVAKGLGPSIYNVDSSLVSATDQAELDRVKANYLIKKLGLKDIRQKPRAVVYYLLAVKLGQSKFYA